MSKQLERWLEAQHPYFWQKQLERTARETGVPELAESSTTSHTGNYKVDVPPPPSSSLNAKTPAVWSSFEDEIGPSTSAHVPPRTTTATPDPALLSDDVQQFIESIITQSSLDLANARAELATKQREIDMLRRRVAELEGGSGGKGKERVYESEDFAMESRNDMTQDLVRVSERLEVDHSLGTKLTGYTLGYVAQLSYETMGREEMKRWVEILIERCRDLEGVNERLRMGGGEDGRGATGGGEGECYGGD
ncbi:hypothetical protein HDV00_011857 [Rhizophlyctis rosea]|nr:hypothetical protein HDV00_011857 [Rhizophlyctis rosea]